MDRNEILSLIGGNSPLKRNQVIIVDESQFSMSSRRWTNTDQQDFMDFLAAARFYGYMICVVALHNDMLDVIARRRIVNYTVEMQDRGVSIVYERYRHPFATDLYPKRKGQLVQQLPDYDKCAFPTCLTCKHRDDCQTIRAVYERKKRKFLVELAKEKQLMADMKMKENKPVLMENMVDTIKKNKDTIYYNKADYMDIYSLKTIILKEYGVNLGERRLKELRMRTIQKYPDLDKRPS